MRAIAAIAVLLSAGAAQADGWVHPAGLIDLATLEDVRHKRETQEWARKLLRSLDAGVQPWLEQPRERLEQLMPVSRMGVYWLLLCPDCRRSMTFDPFEDKQATCPACGKSQGLDQPSTATELGGPNAGTLYEGWGCHYLLQFSAAAERLALLHALGADRAYAERAADILRIFAERTRPLPVAGSGPFRSIWTYAYEGDCSLLTSLVTAYELVRDVDGLFTPEEHRVIQQDLLKYWVDSVFRIEEDHSQRHNNTYRYLTAVGTVGCAIEDADYVDWACGQRNYSPDVRPDHRSLTWLTDNNYLEDGAFWGLCSAYHLYALGPQCRAILFGSKLSQQMPDLFPPELFDGMDPAMPRGQTTRRALKWFTSQALPDLTMAPFGDMGGRVSLATYSSTAEIGYRYLGMEEVGHYPTLRRAARTMDGLLYGADTIEQRPYSHPSAYLASGYVALRRKTADNHLYAGLNALQPGSGHSHGDRLNLITYSRDRLLAGEKRTLYTDPDQRVYSGASYGHNTVTVDETSQVHGDRLTGDQIPRIETFVDLPALQAAEAHGDSVYPQTTVYRRLLCQFDEYLFDLFRVEGGETHDWFHHGIGEEPEVSISVEPSTDFEPASYVVRGGTAYRTGESDGPFAVTWRIPAQENADYPGRRRDVFSRVTLAGQPGQRASILDTYPNPGRHSLMVRHAGPASQFAAVHEAYFDQPIVRSLDVKSAEGCEAYEILHTDGGRRLLIHRSGLGEDGLSISGLLGVVQLDPDARVLSLALLRGTLLQYRGLTLRAADQTCLSVNFVGGKAALVSSPPVAYRTIEGEPMFTPGSDVAVQLTIPAELSPTGRDVRIERSVPGQTAAGPNTEPYLQDN